MTDESLNMNLAQINAKIAETPAAELIAPHLEEGESKTPVQSADCPYCIKNGSYVRIEPDNMTAWLFLVTPPEGEVPYDSCLVEQFLAENGVVQGIHTSNFKAVIKKQVYDREIVIARGKQPVNGIDGHFEFFFETADRRKPTIREDGTVDYTSMSRLSNVAEGEKIAIYHPAVASQNGYDVHGGEIQTKPSKELPSLKGRGFTNAANPNVYIAGVSGKIEYKAGRIDIKSVHEVRGDVDLIAGKIEFFGDIHIKGNVEAGVVIRGSRNVTIEGVVEDAEIYAGGDVVITKGIHGDKRAKISAKGNVSAEFIEFTTVEAGENVRANSFVNSEVYAGGMVMAEGKNGSIIGGNVRGLLGLSAMSIGNDAEKKTTVACGYSAPDYERYVTLFQQENEYQKLLSDTVDRMSDILKRKRLGKVVNEKQLDEELAALNKKKDEYFEALDKARQEKETLSILIEKGKGCCILANDKIYRGTTVVIEGTPMIVPANTCYTRYKNEGGRIVTSVIVN